MSMFFVFTPVNSSVNSNRYAQASIIGQANGDTFRTSLHAVTGKQIPLTNFQLVCPDPNYNGPSIHSRTAGRKYLCPDIPWQFSSSSISRVILHVAQLLGLRADSNFSVKSLKNLVSRRSTNIRPAFDGRTDEPLS